MTICSGRDQRGHPHRHREHLAHLRCAAPAQQVPGADPAHDQRGGQIGGGHHVRQAVGEGLGLKMTVHQSAPAGTGRRRRSRSPCGVCIQLFAERIQNAEISVPTATASVAAKCSRGPTRSAAEQHDAEEARFEEEGGQHLVAPSAARSPARPCRRTPTSWCRTGRTARCPRRRPCRTRSRRSSSSTGTGRGRAALPVREPQPFQHREITREPDREGREDDVKRSP